MKRFTAHRAFTLIETMVAITILTLSIVGPMTVANRALVAADTASDQLTASYLAQEGIEYVRAVRDDQFLALYPGDTTNAWANFLTATAGCRAPNVCTFESAGGVGSHSVCPSGVCGPLWLSAANIYTQVGGVTQTSFTRTIQTVQVNANEEEVVSKVSWSFHGTPYLVTIIDHLTSWQ